MQGSRSNLIEAERYRKQQLLLERELSRVRVLLAHNSKVKYSDFRKKRKKKENVPDRVDDNVVRRVIYWENFDDQIWNFRCYDRDRIIRLFENFIVTRVYIAGTESSLCND